MTHDSLMKSLQSMPKKCMAGLLVLSLGWQSAWAQPSSAPSLGPASSSDLSPALERRLGQAIMVEGRRDPEYVKDPDVSQYLNAMGKRLAVHAPGGAPDIEVFGVRDPVINAFAMPGGYIGVHTGLIVSSGAEDELAGVLAHEIAHVTAKHVHEKLSRELAVGTVGAVGLVGGLAGGVSGLTVNALSQVYGLTTGISGFAFDRSKEKEADYVGLMYMARAGYDPQEAVNVLEALDLESAKDPVQPAILSTHPSNPERIIQLLDAMPKAIAERNKSSVHTGPIIVR
jgi:predicted Zn-dependent protease